MQDQYNDIGAIIGKYPDLNPDEERILKEWMDISETNRKIFEDLTSPDYLLTILKRFEHIESGKKRRWQRVLAGSDVAEPGETNVTTRHTWWRRWQPYAAAASVIFIAGILYYTWQGKQQTAPTEPTPAVVINDAAPGQFKAKLTLDDKTDIVLDSAMDKVLLHQAGIKVVNKDGTLVYEYTGSQRGAGGALLYNTLTTARGQTYATVLSDGTKVWLNSLSSIRYPMAFNDDTRTVETTGEVYFEVAPSVAQLATGQKGKRPFIVKATGLDVEVLGTHFNINSYADEPTIKTTLVEGLVKVVVNQGSERKAIYLAPGEQARLVKQTRAISKTKDVDVEAEVAWRFGMFQFNKADLPTAMRQLEKWYDMEVEYRGSVPEHEFIGTIPRSLHLSKVLMLLEKQNVHFTIEGKKIIVTQ